MPLAPALRLRRSLLFGASLVIPSLAVPFASAPAPALLLILAATAAAHMVLLYGILRPNVSLLGPVVTAFDPGGRNEVWLTIDDGPDPADNPRLLDLLARFGARATFFLVGTRVRACPEAVRAILARGHGIANHTDTHPSFRFWSLAPWRVCREIDGCQSALAAVLAGNPSPSSPSPTFFRPPAGMQNPFLAPRLAVRGLRLIGWTARGFDGLERHEPHEAVARILQDLRPGAIILLHEGRRGPGGEALNVRGLELLLSALRERGYAAVIPADGQLLPRP